jgi:hypothetical protein
MSPSNRPFAVPLSMVPDATTWTITPRLAALQRQPFVGGVQGTFFAATQFTCAWLPATAAAEELLMMRAQGRLIFDIHIMKCKDLLA